MTFILGSRRCARTLITGAGEWFWVGISTAIARNFRTGLKQSFRQTPDRQALGRRFYHALRSPISLAPAMGLGDRMAYPIARIHSRMRFVHRRAGGSFLPERQTDLGKNCAVLDADLCSCFRYGS